MRAKLFKQVREAVAPLSDDELEDFHHQMESAMCWVYGERLRRLRMAALVAGVSKRTKPGQWS